MQAVKCPDIYASIRLPVESFHQVHNIEKASVRLISAFYIILILLYIKFIYNDSNYDSLIFYFVMLAIGRFEVNKKSV